MRYQWWFRAFTLILAAASYTQALQHPVSPTLPNDPSLPSKHAARTDKENPPSINVDVRYDSKNTALVVGRPGSHDKGRGSLISWPAGVSRPPLESTSSDVGTPINSSSWTVFRPASGQGQAGISKVAAQPEQPAEWAHAQPEAAQETTSSTTRQSTLAAAEPGITDLHQSLLGPSLPMVGLKLDADDSFKAALHPLPQSVKVRDGVSAQALGDGVSWPVNNKLDVNQCLVARSAQACLAAPEKRFWLCVRPDGDIQLQDQQSSSGEYAAYWATNTSSTDRTAAIRLCLTEDSLVGIEENSQRTVFYSVRFSNAWRLSIQDDGNLLVSGRNCELIWSSGTPQITPLQDPQCWPSSGVRMLDFQGEKTWYLYEDRRNFTAAQAVCNSFNGDLVAIRSPAEHERYYRAFAGINQHTWVGLRTRSGQFSANLQDWIWVSTGTTPEYNGWTSAGPTNNYPEPSVCASAWFEPGGGAGRFVSNPCSWQLPFACEVLVATVGCDGVFQTKYLSLSTTRIRFDTSITAPCRNPYLGSATIRCQPDGELVYEGGCAKEIQVGDKKLAYVVQWATQAQARAACQQRGGELLTMATTAEQDAIIAEQQDINAGTWIGLESVGRQPSRSKNAFRWLSTGQPPINDWWAADEPSNTADLEGVCVEQSAAAGWSDVACGSTRPFACQIGCSSALLPKTTGVVWNTTICDGTRQDGSCTATCSAGFSPGPIGAPSTLCTAGGWSSPQGSCARDGPTCAGQPANRPYAIWACQSVAANEVCTAQCAEGTQGTFTARCRSSQPGARPTWELPEGVCTPGCSGPPPVTLYEPGWGMQWVPVNFTCPFTVEGGRCAAALVCQDSGVSGPGRATAICLPGGGWAVEVQQCSLPPSLGRPCSTRPQDPPNGMFPPACDPIASGFSPRICIAECTVNATHGFTPSSPFEPVTQCLDGNWSPTKGTCNRGCLGNPSRRAGAWFACRAVTAVGGTCPGTCRTGSGSILATCQQGVDGAPPRWAVAIKQPCRNQCVGNPPSPPNSVFSCNATTAVRGTCTATCASGYTATRPVTATCLLQGRGGRWSVPQGRCSPAICTDSPPNPPNAQFSCGSPTASGGRVTAVGRSCAAQCVSGTTGAPTPTVRCGTDGTWSAVVGACKAVCDPNPCSADPASNKECTALGSNGDYACGCSVGWYWNGALQPGAGRCTRLVGKPQVYLVTKTAASVPTSSPYRSADEAAAACALCGGQLASYQQMQAAQQLNAQWCRWGWTSTLAPDGKNWLAYPMQEPGVAGCSAAGTRLYSTSILEGRGAAANCWGIKPPKGTLGVTAWSSSGVQDSGGTAARWDGPGLCGTLSAPFDELTCVHVDTSGTLACCGNGTAGPAPIICSEGSWRQGTGTCTPRGTCQSASLPSPPLNAAWPTNGCNNVATGAVCRATCAAGFTGTVSSTCTNGQWGGVRGTCA